MTEEERVKKIIEIEAGMAAPDFWVDKARAQAAIKELQELKDFVPGGGKYDKGEAVMTIFAGAGGDDAEDFAAMLFEMYKKYLGWQGWGYDLLSENTNDHGGYRNVTIEIKGKNVYGTLKRESGVHRLVRISPFNSGGKRQTSFVMVEVIPKFDKGMNVEIPESEMNIIFTKSGGPGGQNVNKRETAVRITHIPTKLSVHVDGERNQAQNKEKAIELLRAKLYAIMEDARRAEEAGSYVSKTTEAEWGSQIRSYVLHPYKMIKDHRTNFETANVEKVLERGEIDEFIEAEKSL
ncbi:MAG: PCRF domain-containing protein [Patescibacteria group bacterium]